MVLTYAAIAFAKDGDFFFFFAEGVNGLIKLLRSDQMSTCLLYYPFLFPSNEI